MGLGGARLGRSNRDDRLEVEVVGLRLSLGWQADILQV
jgi:hypothetical protein